MFRRTILRQACLFTARSLVAAAPPRTTVLALRHLRPLPSSISGLPILRSYSSEAADAKPKEKPAQTTEGAVEEAAEQLEKETKINAELERLMKELEAKTSEAKDYKDKFTRVVADFRNLQDRTERDKRSAKDFAIQKFAKDLIESVDNLDRALQAVPEEARSDPGKNKDLIDFYNGLRMTEDILLNTLKKHGMEKLNPVGEVFDPNKHEAIFQVPMMDKEPGTVFHVQQTGFLLNGRTIRAAKVGIVASQK